MDVSLLRNRDSKINLNGSAEASHSLCHSVLLLSASHFGVLCSLSISQYECC